VTAKFLVVPSKATRNVVVAERDITVPFTPPESTDPTAGFGALTAAERVCERQEDRKARRLDR
jgi:hypothetical protein